MSVFGKSLRDYFLFTRTGLLLLLAVGVARFILGVSGVPYDRVTHLVSMSIVAIVLAVIYGQHVAAREFGGYRHLLVIVCLLSATMYGFIIRVRLFWNGGFGMSHSGKGSSHLTRLRWRPLTGTTLPSA